MPRFEKNPWQSPKHRPESRRRPIPDRGLGKPGDLCEASLGTLQP